ncbi:MAG: hypothetical protein K6G27_13230 [Lachnospiraceae bacterium]|nr:hypothetical protein [Lachnospiraceae bacterium]
MDKYEYQVHADEIKKLISEHRYAEAMNIADGIDWRKVRSVSMLQTVSEIYKINKKYEEAREILLLAYDRYPSRNIVYALCELAIKLNDVVQAKLLYEEFVSLAPGDTSRYVLLYRLYEALDVSAEERIELLEEFKQKDYTERWAYELALLYHKTGQETKCVEACDELILWFGEGKYVKKAMELKMKHTRLSKEQQLKYEGRQDPIPVADKFMNINPDTSQQVYDTDPQSGNLQQIPMTPYSQNHKQEMGSISSRDNSTSGVQEQSVGMNISVSGQVTDSAASVSNPETGMETMNKAGEPDNGAIRAETPGMQLSAESSRNDLQHTTQMLTTSEIDKIEIKPVNMGMYNTIDLQNGLSENIKKFFENEKKAAINSGNGRYNTIPSYEKTNNYENAESKNDGHITNDLELTDSNGPVISLKNFSPADNELDEVPGKEEDVQITTFMPGYKSENVYPEDIPDDDTVEEDAAEESDPELKSIYEDWETKKRENEERRIQEAKALSLQQTADIMAQLKGVLPDIDDIAKPTPPRGVSVNPSYYSVPKETEIPETDNGETLQDDEKETEEWDDVDPEENEYRYEDWDDDPEEDEDEYVQSNEWHNNDESSESHEIDFAKKEDIDDSEESEEEESKDDYPETEETPEVEGYEEEGQRDYPEAEETPEVEGYEEEVQSEYPETEEIPGIEGYEEEGWAEYPETEDFPEIETLEDEYPDVVHLEDEFGDNELYVEEDVESEYYAYLAKGYKYVDGSVYHRGYDLDTDVEEESGEAFINEEKPEAVEEFEDKEEPETEEESAVGEEESEDRGEPEEEESAVYEEESEDKKEPEEESAVNEEESADEEEETVTEEPTGNEVASGQGIFYEPEMEDDSWAVEEARGKTEEMPIHEITYEPESGAIDIKSVRESVDEDPEDENDDNTELYFREIMNIEDPDDDETVMADADKEESDGSLSYTEDEEAARKAAFEVTSELPEYPYDELDDYGEVEEMVMIEQPDGLEGIMKTDDMPVDAIARANYEAGMEFDYDGIDELRRNRRARDNKTSVRQRPGYMKLETTGSKREFDEEEKLVFGKFQNIEWLKSQIVEALDEAGMESGKGNVIVMGNEPTGRKAIAVDIVKVMRSTEIKFKGKVAKISGEALNKKDIPLTIKKLRQGALIVENAQDLTPSSARLVAEALELENEPVLVILEGDIKGMSELLDSSRDIMKRVFNARIELQDYSTDDLVSYGKCYARELEYVIDDMGVLALYRRIGDLQTLDHTVTLEEVCEIIDNAIKHVDKKNMSHFMDVLLAKRYDDNDFIILREKDFIQ